MPAEVGDGLLAVTRDVELPRQLSPRERLARDLDVGDVVLDQQHVQPARHHPATAAP